MKIISHIRTNVASKTVVALVRMSISVWFQSSFRTSLLLVQKS